jgi:hypothetical protein
MIILRRPIELELEHRIRLAGKYRLVLREADGTVVRDLEFPNVITNGGLDMLAAGFPPSFMHIGQSTVPPAVTDAAMPTFSATAAGIATSGSIPPSGSNAVSPFETGFTVGRRFNIGQLNGTYTDIGVGTVGGGSPLFSRALIVDSGGTPTPLAVNSTQQLDAFYTLYKYPPLVDISRTVTIASVSYTATGRASQAGALSTWPANHGFNGVSSDLVVSNATGLGAVTASLVGASSSDSADGLNVTSYTNGSYQRDVSFTFSTGRGNIPGGVKGMLFRPRNSGTIVGEFQYFITGSGIPKDLNRTMSLNFRTSWARR